MKKLLLPVSTILLISISTVLLSCGKDNEELGKQAAKEFCDCRKKGSSMDDCEKKLKKDYSNSRITTDDFMDAFNKEAAKCGVKLNIL